MYSSRKRKELSDSSTQHGTQLSKRRRNEKEQGRREIAGSQYSTASSIIDLTITATTTTPPSAPMVPHPIRKRKEPSNPLTQHSTQLPKKRRNEKKQGQREIVGSQYSAASSVIDLTTTAIAATPPPTTMVPHSIRKRKEPSDSPAQHDTQLSKRRRNEKKQGQREIAGSQYSRSGASRAKDIKSYTPMTPPSLTANTVNDWSSPSSWMRSSNYNNRNPNTPSSNSGIANDVSSSYSWTRSSNCNNRNPNQMHRTLMRGPATKLETIWESVWESEPYLVPQAKDDEATAISNRNGAAAIYVRSSHDTAATALLSTVVSSASVKSTGSQPDHVIQTDAVEGSTALISPKPRPHE